MSVFIIAEAGVNHNGSLDSAFKLIDIAVQSGANAVKFQTFKAKNIVSKSTQKADYQKQYSDPSESQYSMLKNLELNKENHEKLIEYCDKANIIFLSSPFDIESIELLHNLGLEIFKIPSGEITNLPYLNKIGSLNKKVILSTGMASIDEIVAAIKILIDAGMLKENITVLHANTMYPTPIKDVNLNAMETIAKKCEVSCGYSDHTLGIEVAIAAVAMGATVIEKHFTLDTRMKGPDHKASLNPKELTEMVKAIRNIEKAMGNGVKIPSNSEKQNMIYVRKSIVASKKIKKGEVLNGDNLSIKRPGNGISPMEWNKIIGTLAKKNYHADELI
jgi:N,N'-diacetyllegionaminate synthase